MAKEALSAGDKILHENYLQHSDHFSRILTEIGLEKTKNSVDENSKKIQETSILNK